MVKVKITCLTPKGKVQELKQIYENYLFMVKKPVKTEVINDESIYFIYELKDDKELLKLVNKKIPHAVKTIRDTYWLIIHLITRANKKINDTNWTLDKALNWANRMFAKQQKDKSKQVSDFFKDIKLEDKEEFLQFLSKDLISWEVIE